MNVGRYEVRIDKHHVWLAWWEDGNRQGMATAIKLTIEQAKSLAKLVADAAELVETMDNDQKA